MAKIVKKPLIGFIGQGWIGRNYADDFEARGYDTVRYSLESHYVKNKEKIKKCDIVFIAVPTPTTPHGFDASIVESAFKLVGKGKVAVVKSTILPGTTVEFQKKNPGVVIVYAPEFLSEGTAAYDAAHPFSNIVGIPVDDKAHRDAADRIFEVLPAAPFKLVCSSTEAEVIKYSHNMSGYTQIITFNLLYDIALKLGCSWSNVYAALSNDPYICNRYSQPVHKSGRGAGGGCFIKDFAAYAELYKKEIKDKPGIAFLEAAQKKNIDLLVSSNKDLHLLEGVYGPDVVRRAKKSR
jgi:UDPglucose 6-dehydrogenase